MSLVPDLLIMAAPEDLAMFSSNNVKASLLMGTDLRSEKGRENFLAKEIEPSSDFLS